MVDDVSQIDLMDGPGIEVARSLWSVLLADESLWRYRVHDSLRIRIASNSHADGIDTKFWVDLKAPVVLWSCHSRVLFLQRPQRVYEYIWHLYDYSTLFPLQTFKKTFWSLDLVARQSGVGTDSIGLSWMTGTGDDMSSENNGMEWHGREITWKSGDSGIPCLYLHPWVSLIGSRPECAVLTSFLWCVMSEIKRSISPLLS